MLTSEHTAKEIEQKAKRLGDAEAWCIIYANTAQCDSHIRKVETRQITLLLGVSITWCQHYVDMAVREKNCDTRMTPVVDIGPGSRINSGLSGL